MYRYEEKQHSKLKNLNLIILGQSILPCRARKGIVGCLNLDYDDSNKLKDICFDILTKPVLACEVHCKFQIHKNLYFFLALER